MIVDNEDLNTAIERLVRPRRRLNHEDAVIFVYCEHVVTVSGLELLLNFDCLAWILA